MIRAVVIEKLIPIPGPLHAQTVLLLYPFRFRDPVTRKWVKARYVAERSELEARYKEFEIIGEPEYRRVTDDRYFSPWRSDKPRP